jgi:hypothetical protein
MKTLLSMPDAAKKAVNEYLSMQLTGKKFACPYFMNKRKQRGGLRVMIGKGSPQEICSEVKIIAHLKGFDLENATPEQIRKFMLERDIGIDCSGFVVQVLNAWLTSEHSGKLMQYLKFSDGSLVSRLRRTLRQVENIGAESLTSTTNCDRITDLNQVQPGNLVRLKAKEKNSHHVLLISSVILEDDRVLEFEYVNSTQEYGTDNGVRTGKVLVTNPAGDLKDQQWLDADSSGRNWVYNGLLKDYSDNGLRRLNRVALSFQKTTLG